MARVKIELPSTFPFETEIPVRITDLNYGGHVGNDKILSLVHEARVEFLTSLGYSELDMHGVSLIMADAALEYKAELFYKDRLIVSVSVSDIGSSSFDLIYKLEKMSEAGRQAVAYAKTGMVCFDYQTRKVVRLPEEVRLQFSVP